MGKQYLGTKSAHVDISGKEDVGVAATLDAAHVAATDPHSQYILVAGTRAFTGTQTTQTLLADANETRNIGDSTNRFGSANITQLRSVQGTGTINAQAVNKGGMLSAQFAGAGTKQVTLNGGSYKAALVIGNVVATQAGANCSVLASKGGAVAIGSSFTFGAGTTTVRATGYSAIAMGYAYGSGTATLEATNSGSLAFGYSFARSSTGTTLLRSSGRGSFAAGMCRAHTNTGTCTINAGGHGSFAQGYARTAATFNSTVQATGSGSFAQGYAKSGTAGANASITASAKGSFAVGYALNTTISATAVNAVQFGVGTNANTDSLQVGSGVLLFSNGQVRLVGKTGTAVDGDIWNDSTQKALQTFVGGVEQTLIGTIFTQTADKTIANTISESSLLGTGVGTLTLPANFWTVGKTIRVQIHGDFADTGLPTADVKILLGATALIDSTATSLKGLGGTEQWECNALLTCRSVGSTGTIQTTLDWEYETTTGSSALERLDITGTVTTIDTTAAAVLDVTFTWGTAAAANTLTSEIGCVEVLH